MRISRLFVPQALESGATVVLAAESVHYLLSVLRLRAGDALVAFNGAGGEFPARVVEIGRDRVSLSLGLHDDREAESGLQTHLGLGISRAERMDLGIQKAVELGVTAITPLFTERCVVRLSGDRIDQRLHHWRMVVRSACEQCGRNRLPPLHPPEGLTEWLHGQSGMRLFLHPHGGRTLRQLAPPSGPVALLSGPEGGFSDGERQQALSAGFIPLRLGPRVLRTETAALAGLAALQSLWGDIGS